ncbi:MAG: phosphoribosylamine--glycine ligase [Bacillota bacterium]
MNVMILGSGGREHALAWKFRQDERIDKIYIAPGNGGTAEIGENVDIKLSDFPRLIDFVSSKAVDYTIVGPEKPLAAGIVDSFKKANLNIFGPTKSAARLEASKIFAKEIMTAAGVPTADYTVVKSSQTAFQQARTANYPVVIKADGLAAGKGVYIVHDIAEAETAITELMLEKKFGSAGENLIFEEFLPGRELSLLVLVDNGSVKPLLPARDYKKALNHGKGPNTGGMGAFAPDRDVTADNITTYLDRLIKPVITELKRRGITYQGLLYCGIIITNSGPKVLEYNVRFGDPEAQVILPLLENDLLDVVSAVCTNQLKDINLTWQNKTTVTTVAASGGYPDDYETGYPIEGLDTVKLKDNITVFHAGTCRDDDKVLTTGGRVLAVTGRAADISTARQLSLSALKEIKFKDMYYRSDIAKPGGE